MACKAKRGIASDGGRRGGRDREKNIIPHILSSRKEKLKKMCCCRFNDSRKTGM